MAAAELRTTSTITPRTEAPARAGARVLEPGSEGHGSLPNFTFSVRLLPGGGGAGANVTGYSNHILPPHGAPAACSPQLARRTNVASRNQVARIHLRPPAGGWCDGHYRVTVTLTR